MLLRTPQSLRAPPSLREPQTASNVHFVRLRLARVVRAHGGAHGASPRREGPKTHALPSRVGLKPKLYHLRTLTRCGG